MQLEITAKNIELSPQVRRHIEGKLGKLGRHLASISEAKLEIAEERTRSPQHRFIAQLTIDSNGTLLRGEQRGENLLTAIDKVAEIMDRQIRRYKGKLYHKGRGNSPARGRSGQPAATPPVANRVVKVKRFAIKPMLLDEAIEQMELLGHDFFLFFNSDRQGLSLLYRRRNGDYGLIEPELDKE